MTRKPSPVQRIGAASSLPKQMPRIPEEFVRKFKELEAWQGELDGWWYDVVSSILADSAQVRQELNLAKSEIAVLKGETA